MTEQTEAVPELPVPYLGRDLIVRLPSHEQLLVWQRTIRNLGDAPTDAKWTGVEVMAALERLLKIVNSLLSNPADITWLDDQLLLGNATFQNLTPWLTDVLNAFAEYNQETGNREERRAAAKSTKKAARKKVTS